MYHVYIHTLPNGRKYVGATTNFLHCRWDCGRGYRGTKFFEDIQKVGWDKVLHEVFEVESKEEMFYLERYLISYFDTTNPEKGYNKAKGGPGSRGAHWKLSEDTRKKMSEANKGKVIPEETRRKISETLKKRKLSL